MNNQTESKVRRMARQQGLSLHKSRSRTPERYHFGTYQLVDEHGALIAGDQNTGFGMSLEEVAAALTSA